MSDLTPKQQAFAMTYVETGNASEAYRRAYDVAENTVAQVVWNEASKLLSHPYVSVRVAELQMEAAERHAVTVSNLTVQLDEDRKLARENGQASAAIAAVMAKAKLHGKLADKHQMTGKDGTPFQVIFTAQDRALL